MRTNLQNPKPLNQSAPKANFDFRQFRRGYRGGGYRRPFRQIIKVSEPVVSQNPEFNSTEIRFPNAPSEAMRQHMGKSGLGWTWNKWTVCWYKRNVEFVEGQERDRTAAVIAEAEDLVQRFQNEMTEANTQAVEEGVMVS